MAVLLIWWLLIAFLSLLALPLTLAVFRNLPDRGYPLARVLGILLPSFLAWFLGMWQLASFGQGLLTICLLVLAGLSGLMLWKDRSILRFFREHWQLVLLYEGIFVVALLFGALLRIYGPWGGVAIAHTEQPMDFALMNGIVQSRSLPPQDPWLSGYPINYYYLGYLQAASLTLLSGLPSAVTFNLNLALLFALAAMGCFSLGYNLTMATAPPQRWRAIIAGSLAIVLTLIVGNQVGALQVLTGSNQATVLNLGEALTVLGGRLTGKDPIPLGHTVYTTGDFGGHFDAVQPTGKHQIGDFDWWWPSRVLWDERPSLEAIGQIRAAGQVERAIFGWRSYVPADQIERSYAITEFPSFSFYLGDMHPHVMALPLVLTALALALNVLLAPDRGRPGLGPGAWGWFFLIPTAVVLGGLYMANSWDLPTYLLVYAMAWIWRWRKGCSGGWSRKDTWAVIRDLAILVGLCILLYLPFFVTFRSLVGSKPVPEEIAETPVLGRIAGLPVLRSFFQTVGLVFWDKTSLYTFLVIFGLSLYPIITWLVAKAVERRVPRPPQLWFFLGLWLGPCVLAAILLGFPLLAALPVLTLAWMLLGRSKAPAAFVLIVLFVALLIALGCDLFYIRDVFESRMNTIFKFYYQGWILLAIAAAWAIIEVPRAHLRHALVWAVWIIPLALLLAGGLVYPALSLNLALEPSLSITARRSLLQPVLSIRPPPHGGSLDGLISMRTYQAGDYAGVQWILENTAPDAVVLEAAQDQAGFCEWNPNCGRISAATGRPTLLGWEGHEQQWRGGDPKALAEVLGQQSETGAAIRPRREVVQEIYSTTEPARAGQLLEQYGVDYVFIGSLEASVFPEGLAKFGQLGTLAFEAPGVKIYQVNR